MEPKWTPQECFFYYKKLLKSFFFLAKTVSEAPGSSLKAISKNSSSFVLPKMWFFTTHGFTSAKLRFPKVKDRFFEVFGGHFLVYF